MEIIDAHHHLWHYDPVSYAWIDDSMKGIRRDFLPEDLRPVLAEHGVSGTIAVQADSSLRETDFLLKQAAENDFILGVVGWVDLMSENLEADLDALEGAEKLVGFRHIVQGEPDPLFLMRPEFLRGVEMIFERGYTYDLLIYPHQLPAALEFLICFPDQPIVIDHIAKPYIKEGLAYGWGLLMAEIADFDYVYCKLSGMITEADWSAWDPDHIHPYLEIITDCFPADRLMYGSDWPVLNVAGDYGQALALVKSFIADLPVESQKRIMAGTAREFYLK